MTPSSGAILSSVCCWWNPSNHCWIRRICLASVTALVIDSHLSMQGMGPVSILDPAAIKNVSHLNTRLSEKMKIARTPIHRRESGFEDFRGEEFNTRMEYREYRHHVRSEWSSAISPSFLSSFLLRILRILHVWCHLLPNGVKCDHCDRVGILDARPPYFPSVIDFVRWLHTARHSEFKITRRNKEMSKFQ